VVDEQRRRGKPLIQPGLTFDKFGQHRPRQRNDGSSLDILQDRYEEKLTEEELERLKRHRQDEQILRTATDRVQQEVMQEIDDMIDPSAVEFGIDDQTGTNDSRWDGHTLSQSCSDERDLDKTIPWDPTTDIVTTEVPEEITFRPPFEELQTSILHYVDIPYGEYSGPNYSHDIIMTEGCLFETNEAMGHCISADIHMGAGIAYDFKCEFGGVQELFMQRILPGDIAILERDVDVGDGEIQTRFIYNLITKTNYWGKPTMATLTNSLIAMKNHAVFHRVPMICLPRIGAGLDGLPWRDVYYAIAKTFEYTGIKIRIFLLPRMPTCYNEMSINSLNKQERTFETDGLWFWIDNPTLMRDIDSGAEEYADTRIRLRFAHG
jgi:O-acetyl-ADP-ribose deacetylase (regulator of RNase III)